MIRSRRSRARTWMFLRTGKILPEGYRTSRQNATMHTCVVYQVHTQVCHAHRGINFNFAQREIGIAPVPSPARLIACDAN